MFNRIKIITTLVLLSLISIPSLGSTGVASWYGGFHHGKRTASGAIFNQNALTAAHKSLPFGSKVKVTNLENKKSVVVTINDRGPFKAGRIIDLSKKANGILDCELCKVTVKILSKGDGIYRKE